MMIIAFHLLLDLAAATLATLRPFSTIAQTIAKFSHVRAQLFQWTQLNLSIADTNFITAENFSDDSIMIFDIVEQEQDYGECGVYSEM